MSHPPWSNYLRTARSRTRNRPPDFDRIEPAQPVPADQVAITTSPRLPKSIMDDVRARAENTLSTRLARSSADRLSF